MKDAKARQKSAARTRKPEPAKKKSPPPRPPDQGKALEEFGHAVRLLQKRDFLKARDELRAILQKYPDEKELADRARTYLQVCARSLQPPAPRLKDADDHYYQGVFHLNQRNHDEAIRLFEKALALDPESEKILYAQATAYAQSGRREAALEALRRAIAANAANRHLAAKDDDFEALRSDEEFRRLVGGAGGAAA